MIKLWLINCLYSIVSRNVKQNLAKHAKQPASHTATKWFAKFDSDTETTNSCKATFCCLSDCLSKAWQESFVRLQFSWNCETKLVSQLKLSLAQILRLFIMSLFAKNGYSVCTKLCANCWTNPERLNNQRKTLRIQYDIYLYIILKKSDWIIILQ